MSTLCKTLARVHKCLYFYRKNRLAMPAHMKIRITFAVLFCAVLTLKAQVNTDSLWNVWNDTRQPDTVRLQAMQFIVMNLIHSNPDSTYALALKQMEFARSAGNRAWQGKIANTVGAYFYTKGSYALALGYYQKGLAIVEPLGDKKSMAAFYGNIALTYRNLGNYAKSIEYNEKCLAIQEELKNKKGISSSYNNIGALYNDQENYPRALEYFQKALQLNRELNDQRGIALSYSNIGAAYTDQGDLSNALEYHLKSIAIKEKLQDKHGLAFSYNNIGLIYKKEGNYSQALEYYRKCLTLMEELGDKQGIASTYASIGSIFHLQKKYSGALEWCKKGLELGGHIGATRIERDACHCMYTVYKSLGKSEDALIYHERLVVLNDSLQKNETDQKLGQMEFARQVMADSLAQNEEKLKMEMAHQKEVRSKNRTLNLLFIWGLVILVLALGFWSRMLYFRKNAQVFQLKAEQLEKQQLLNEIALLRSQVNPHFLFNSLSILSSLVRVNTDLSEQFIDQLSRSYRYILEQKEQSLVPLRTELEFIRSYAFLLKIRFENKFDLNIHLSDEALDQFRIAPLTLQLLIENAVKHNRMSAKEPLHIEISAGNDHLVVKNQLQPRTTSPASTGIGLQNIKNRYALLTNRPVWAGEEAGQFVVKVPLL